MPIERVESGIPGLDRLIEGGFVKGSVNLIAGQTGTGKTIFCNQFILHGLRNGEPGVYLTLEQRVEDIIADVARFGWDKEIKKYMDAEKLIMAFHTPTDFKELEKTGLGAIKKVNAKRFVLDSLTVAAMGWKVSAMDKGKVRSEILSFINMLKSTGVTALLITEIPEEKTKALSRFGFEEFLADGILILHYLEYAAGGTPRSLIIRKMRRTNHGTDIYPIEITKNGIIVKKS